MDRPNNNILGLWSFMPGVVTANRLQALALILGAIVTFPRHTYNRFGVGRTVDSQFYPYTKDGEVVAYKQRVVES